MSIKKKAVLAKPLTPLSNVTVADAVKMLSDSTLAHIKQVPWNNVADARLSIEASIELALRSQAVGVAIGYKKAFARLMNNEFHPVEQSELRGQAHIDELINEN